MDSKSIFTSVTFWGAVLSLLLPMLAPTLNKYGIPLPAVDTLAGKVVEAITFGVTLYGRFHATQPVHVVPPGTPSSGAPGVG